MRLIHPGVAGTLESSDVQVTVDPAGEGIQLDISSDVINQFGRQIRSTVLEVLQRLEVRDARVKVVDKGALDCTLRARLECAVFRAGGAGSGIPWGGAVR